MFEMWHLKHQSVSLKWGVAATCLGGLLSILPGVGHAQDKGTVAANSGKPEISLRHADPSESADGSLSPAAKAAIQHGPLPFNDADVAGKAAADRAREAAEKASGRSPFSSADSASVGNAGPLLAAPAVVGALNFAGQTDTCGTPPDTTGVIGPFRFVQLVNCRAGIYNRTNGAVIASGTLNQLANVPASVNSFDPQIIWDPTTARFYYVMDSIFSSSDNRLSFGFSKTNAPNNVTTDWCHYTLAFGTRFPDFPKLGDSQFFMIIGVNSFNLTTGAFLGSDLVGISKPAAGLTCPAASTFKIARKLNLVDTAARQVFTPVPANQIDTSATGYVVARNGDMPSTKLWFFNVTRNPSTLLPVFGTARGATVVNYTFPPNASQPNFSGGVAAPLLDTSDARPTQAVQAVDPRLGTFSFWTQHTIANGTAAAMVRWYEINPVPAVPVVQRQANIAATNSFLFNAAISPDRRVDGATVGFGNSFVVEYNVSSKVSNISPRIVAGSSVNGGAMSFLLVKNGVGPYRDFSCPSPGSLCRWGDYSGATPDPKPTLAGKGQVWGTNQFSGVFNPPLNPASWRTQIFNLAP